MRHPSAPLVLAVCLALGAASGCTSGPDEPGPTASARPTASGAPTDSGGPADPLATITDPSSGDFVAEEFTTVLDDRGTGSATFTVPRSAADDDLRFYVACSPDSRFTVTVGTFFSGQCSQRFQNSGQLPLPEGSGPISVTLELPDSVDYWLVAISLASPEAS